MSELNYCDICYTVTLTYDDENLPEKSNLKIEDVQRFFKKLRKKGSVYYRYYYAGEYGEKGGRPHYHVLLYCYYYKCLLESPDVKQFVKESWILGNCYFDLTSGRSIRYTLDYLQKDYFRWKNKRDIEPFQRMSNSIGLQFLVDNEKQIAMKGYINVGQVKYRVPKYFRRKSELVNNSINEKNSERLESSDLRKEELYQNYLENCYEISERSLQAEKNIKQRKKLKRGSL